MAPPDERSGMLLAGRRLVTPTAVYEPGWVHVSGSSVTDVGAGAPPRRPDFDLSWATLVPGFIDAHAHGGGGHAYTDHDVDAAAAAAALHLVHGTTTTLASLVTASTEDLVLSVRLLSPLVDDGILVGLHLEGPWLSPHHAGAHDPAQLRTPRPTEVQHLLDTAGGRVRMVTLAPELDGGLDAVRRVVGYGAVAAIGHTDATYATTRAALAAGATAGTHLFNAMRPIHHREPGPIPALLHDDRAYLELIADGVHLHPAILAGTIRRADPREPCLSATRWPPPGRRMVGTGSVASTSTSGTDRRGSHPPAPSPVAPSPWPLLCATRSRLRGCRWSTPSRPPPRPPPPCLGCQTSAKFAPVAQRTWSLSTTTYR